MATCGKCKGSGYVLVHRNTYNSFWKRWILKQIKQICFRCSGSGKIPDKAQ